MVIFLVFLFTPKWFDSPTPLLLHWSILSEYSLQIMKKNFDVQYQIYAFTDGQTRSGSAVKTSVNERGSYVFADGKPLSLEEALSLADQKLKSLSKFKADQIECPFDNCQSRHCNIVPFKNHIKHHLRIR